MFHRPALAHSVISSLIALCAVLPPALHAADPAPAAVLADEESPGARSARLQERAEALQREADASYAAAETKCRQRFQVNRCIDEAKAERLQTIHQARALKAEARQIELAERRRNAEAMQARPAAAARTNAADAADAAAPADSTPIAQRIRSQRAQGVEARAQEQAKVQAEKDAARKAERGRIEAAAAERAAKAAADRERYDRRRQQHEAKQADSAGPAR